VKVYRPTGSDKSVTRSQWALGRQRRQHKKQAN